MERRNTLKGQNTDGKAVNLNDKASRNPQEEKENVSAWLSVFQVPAVQTQLSVAQCDADAAKSNRVNRDTLAGYCRRSEGC